MQELLCDQSDVARALVSGPAPAMFFAVQPLATEPSYLPVHLAGFCLGCWALPSATHLKLSCWRFPGLRAAAKAFLWDLLRGRTQLGTSGLQACETPVASSGVLHSLQRLSNKCNTAFVLIQDHHKRNGQTREASQCQEGSLGIASCA